MHAVDASAPDTPVGVAALHLPRLPAQPPTLQLEARLTGHSDRVWCVAWCPTEDLLASCSGDATVRMWARRGSGAIAASAHAPPAERDWHCVAVLQGEHTRTVRHVSWSPSGSYLACASFDHTATVWRRNTPGDGAAGGVEFEVEGVLDGHESEVKCVAWATDATLATCSRDHNVWIWDRVEEGEYECAGILTGHMQDVKYCLWLLPGGGVRTAATTRPQVLSCGYDNTIRVWSDSQRQDDWHTVQTMTQHTGTVWAAAVQKLDAKLPALRGSDDDEAADDDQPEENAKATEEQPLLCTCSDDLSVLFWRRGANGKWTSVASCSGFCERSIYAVDWAPAGWPVVACASGDDSISLVGLYCDPEGLHTRLLTRQEHAHMTDVNTVSFASSVGETRAEAAASAMPPMLLASGGDDNEVRIWRVV